MSAKIIFEIIDFYKKNNLKKIYNLQQIFKKIDIYFNNI